MAPIAMRQCYYDSPDPIPCWPSTDATQCGGNPRTPCADFSTIEQVLDGRPVVFTETIRLARTSGDLLYAPVAFVEGPPALQKAQ